MVLVAKPGPRPDIFIAGKSQHQHSNPALKNVGTMIIFASLPMVIVSCLFFFEATGLAVSVTMADISIGLVLNIYGAAWLAL